MPSIPVHHRPTSGRLGRRTLLADLGRVTLGAVVLGPALAACTDDGDGAADPDPTGAATDAPEQDGGSPSDGATGEEAAAGQWERASFGFVSAYVLVRDGEALVFDTGTGDEGVGPIADALTASGVGWDAVSTVLVSHEHADHIGGVPGVAAEAPDAVFHAALPDLDAFRGQVATAVEVADGDRVLGLRIVATPGHTPGHVSALDDDAGLLLVGDALVNGVAIGGASGDGVELSPPDFTADAEAAAASGRVLAGLTFDVALFGHGEPIEAGASEQVAAAVG